MIRSTLILFSFLFNLHFTIYSQDYRRLFEVYQAHLRSNSRFKIDSAISNDYRSILTYNSFDSLVSASFKYKHSPEIKISLEYADNKKSKTIFLNKWSPSLNKYIPFKEIAFLNPKEEFFYNDNQELYLHFKYRFENEKYIPDYKHQYIYKDTIMEKYNYAWNSKKSTFEIASKDICKSKSDKVLEERFLWDEFDQKFLPAFLTEVSKINKKGELLSSDITFLGETTNYTYEREKNDSSIVINGYCNGNLSTKEIFDLNNFLLEKNFYDLDEITNRVYKYKMIKRVKVIDNKNFVVFERTKLEFDKDFERWKKVSSFYEYYSLKNSSKSSVNFETKK